MPAEGDLPIVPPVVVPPVIAPVVPPAGSWFSGFDADTQAYVTSKGLDKVDWQTAFKNVAESHKQAEAYIGIPKDQLLRAPNPADPASVKAFWSKFGVPETPEGYDLSAVKRADGTDLDPGFVGFLRQTAAATNLPAEAVTKFASEYTKFQDARDAAETEVAKAALTTQQAALKALWGPNYGANLALADQAAKRLGVDVDTAALLGEKIGADKVLEMLRKVGAATAEDTFVAAIPRAGDTPPMTVVEAKQRMAQMQGDKEFGARLLNGDFQAKKEWDAAFAGAHPDLVSQAAG